MSRNCTTWCGCLIAPLSSYSKRQRRGGGGKKKHHQCNGKQKLHRQMQPSVNATNGQDQERLTRSLWQVNNAYSNIANNSGSDHTDGILRPQFASATLPSHGKPCTMSSPPLASNSFDQFHHHHVRPAPPVPNCHNGPMFNSNSSNGCVVMRGGGFPNHVGVANGGIKQMQPPPPAMTTRFRNPEATVHVEDIWTPNPNMNTLV